MILEESSENYSTGWICIFRSFMKWEWYSDSQMVHLFLHILLKANHTDKKWKGKTIKRGEFITGLNQLSKETNISIQSIRTRLKKLESTHELTIKKTNKYSIITVVQYEYYQSANTQTNKQLTFNQQTINKQLTTTNNVNNYNNEKNDNKKEIIPYSKKEKLFSEDVLNCYDCLINFFPENLWPKKKEDWLDTIDKLNRIDNVPFEKIIELTKKAREDDFWSGTFLSLKKLRTKNNDGIMYIVVFNEKFKKKKLTPTEKIFETAEKNLEGWDN